MEKKPVVLPPPWTRAWRAVKTVFFLFTMIGSLLLFSTPPLLVAILDLVLPSAFLNCISPFSVESAVKSLRNYEFRTSLIDVPIVSIARTIIILCVYGACDVPGRSRGPYLTITMLCSMSSMAFVAAKASAFGSLSRRRPEIDGGRDGLAVEAMLMSSIVLAVAHVVVAYRTSCRERRKLLVYRIDLEAVPASKIGLAYHKSYYSH